MDSSALELRSLKLEFVVKLELQRLEMVTCLMLTYIIVASHLAGWKIASLSFTTELGFFFFF